MLSHQGLCGTMHGLLIQWGVYPGGPVAPQGRPAFAIKNEIAIRAACGAKARMKIIGDFGSPQDVYVVAEIGVGAAYPGMGLAYRAGIHVNNLAGCMYTGIGSSSTVATNWCRSNLTQRLL